MNRLRASLVSTLLLICGLQPLAIGQDGQRGNGVNVRLRTEHYAIGGTVSEARLREYGRLLEFIYVEYEKGFATLLNSGDVTTAGKSGGRAAQRSPGKNSKSNGTADKPVTRKKSNNRDQGADKKPTGPAAGKDKPESDDQSDDALFPVAIFSSTKEYQTQTRQYLGHNAEHTIGMFIPATRMLLIADQGNTRETQEVLFHEAFHQFLNEHLADAPVWLNEGLATHYGSAVPAGKGIAFTNVPTIRWKLAREAIEGKKAISISDVVNASYERFYDKTPIKIDDFDNVTRSTLYYAQAYTLVHMLLHDAEGKKRLQNYIRDLARDREGRTAEITERYFDEKTCTALGPHWIKHVKSGPRSR